MHDALTSRPNLFSACNDAQLLLQASANDTVNSFEIVIGGYGNSKTEIRRGASVRTRSRHVASDSRKY